MNLSTAEFIVDEFVASWSCRGYTCSPRSIFAIFVDIRNFEVANVADKAVNFDENIVENTGCNNMAVAYQRYHSVVPLKHFAELTS
jgi:hypothetical protein